MIRLTKGPTRQLWLNRFFPDEGVLVDRPRCKMLPPQTSDCKSVPKGFDRLAVVPLYQKRDDYGRMCVIDKSSDAGPGGNRQCRTTPRPMALPRILIIRMYQRRLRCFEEKLHSLMRNRLTPHGCDGSTPSWRCRPYREGTRSGRHKKGPSPSPGLACHEAARTRLLCNARQA